MWLIIHARKQHGISLFVLTLDSLKYDTGCASASKETVFLSLWSTGETWQHKNYKIFNSTSAVIYMILACMQSGILCVTWQNYMQQHRLARKASQDNPDKEQLITSCQLFPYSFNHTRILTQVRTLHPQPPHTQFHENLFNKSCVVPCKWTNM